MSSSPFCTCTHTACRCHPANHDQGCNLCIQKELKKDWQAMEDDVRKTAGTPHQYTITVRPCERKQAQ